MARAAADTERINDPATRRRLTPAAIIGFLGIAERWQLSIDDQRVLLGGLGRSTVIRWKHPTARPTVLGIDRLTRISYLLGIYEGLERIFRQAPHEADAWVRRVNADTPFFDQTPLAFMRTGGLPALAAVRSYVDDWAAGPMARALWSAR